eukprot:GEMP01016893.1.p1 GENE.GEMP01016893.1~~GEMP01016893.1.p1  ORF type:complete len:642 (+),score=136.40 GEMP01016893.1:233-2158(+)
MGPACSRSQKCNRTCEDLIEHQCNDVLFSEAVTYEVHDSCVPIDNVEPTPRGPEPPWAQMKAPDILDFTSTGPTPPSGNGRKSKLIMEKRTSVVSMLSGMSDELASRMFEAIRARNEEVFAVLLPTMVQAVRNVDEVRDRLEDGDSPLGNTLLLKAVQANLPTMVESLLRAGANPLLNVCGTTPLHAAAVVDSEECTLILLDRIIASYQFASINDLLNEKGRDPMSLAGPKTQRVFDVFNALQLRCTKQRIGDDEHSELQIFSSIEEFRNKAWEHLFGPIPAAIREPIFDYDVLLRDKICDSLARVEQLINENQPEPFTQMCSVFSQWNELRTSTSCNWCTFSTASVLSNSFNLIFKSGSAIQAHVLQAALWFITREHWIYYLSNLASRPGELSAAMLPIMNLIQNAIVWSVDLRHYAETFIAVTASEKDFDRLKQGLFCWFGPRFVLTSSSRARVCKRLGLANCLICIRPDPDLPCVPVRTKAVSRDVDDVIFPWWTAFKVARKPNFIDGASFGFAGKMIAVVELFALRPLRPLLQEGFPMSLTTDDFAPYINSVTLQDSIDAYIVMGNFHLERGDFPKAHSSYRDAVNMAEQVQSPELPQLMERLQCTTKIMATENAKRIKADEKGESDPRPEARAAKC